MFNFSSARHWILALCTLLFVSTFPAAASSQTPQQIPSNAICEIPVTGPRSVRAAFEEFYECTEPIIETWLKKHPTEVAALEKTYQIWKSSRLHDLRYRPSASAWAKKHPVKSTIPNVHLTAHQSDQTQPLVSAEPVEVPGKFERIFIDRDNQRLFLTSAEEGLVSISIAQRYAFSLEGKTGQAGGRDFFIYDANTAFIEEPGARGADRDLVVLDISDRTQPREITRLKGAIPNISTHRTVTNPQMNTPPTFGQYLAAREGRINTQCGNSPTVSTHPDVFCRPDGSCYKIEHASQLPEKSQCLRPPPRQMHTLHSPTPPQTTPPQTTPPQTQRPGGEGFGRIGGLSQTGGQSGAGGMGMRGAGNIDTAGSTNSTGGTGGAGSLSQMMIYGSHLYVLTTAGPSQGWLTTFDVSNPRKPKIRHLIALDNGPEALQRHDNLLLIAGRAAVITTSLAKPHTPRLLGEFRQNCPASRDPIVVHGHIAYRTLIIPGRRSDCTSRLEVIDLHQPHHPRLHSTHPIDRPRGLAILGQRLFVADERHGITLFNLKDPLNPQPVGTWPLPGVKDLIISDFDLYALTNSQILTYYIGNLFRPDLNLTQTHQQTTGSLTITRPTR